MSQSAPALRRAAAIVRQQRLAVFAVSEDLLAAAAELGRIERELVEAAEDEDVLTEAREWLGNDVQVSEGHDGRFRVVEGRDLRRGA